MDRLLRGALAHIRRGNLVMSSATGRAMRFGDGTGPPIAARFTSKWAQLGALLDPELRFGEAYMDGTFVVEQGSITDFLDLVAREQAADPPWAVPLAVMRYAWRRLSQLNWRSHARDNVAHHYDLDHRLYSLFLDSDRQYSCGYFETPTERWTMPSSPRNVTWRQSSSRVLAAESSTSAADGAALQSISPSSVARR
jgi:cyclopropane-fatty-acyl-phospholipid synthase